MGAKELIIPQDFLSAEIRIRLRNLGTETVVDSRVRTVGNVAVEESARADLIQILEIMANGMVLSIPRYTCAPGHTLELDLHVARLSEKPVELRLVARVKSVEKASEDQERVVVELKMISELEWKRLCGLFTARQEAIHDFFRNVRGY